MVVLDVTIVGDAFHIVAAALTNAHSPALCRGLATTRLLPSVEDRSTSRSNLQPADVLGRRAEQVRIGRASLARENEAAGSWGQEVHILHVNI